MTEKEVINEGGDVYEENIDKYEETEDNVLGGGWCWCLVAACFLGIMINDIMVYSFGMVLLDGGGSIPSVVWLFAAVTIIIGAYLSVNVNRLGRRITYIVGSMIATVTVFASSNSTSAPSLVVCYGLLVGFGLWFVYIPLLLAVWDYLRGWLTYVTGLYVLFGLLIAPSISSSLAIFGLYDLNRVMALLCLDCAFFGLAMNPNKRNREQVTKNYNDKGFEEEKDNSRLVNHIPFILMLLSNFTNAFAIYFVYSSFPHIALPGVVTTDTSSFFISGVTVTNTVGRIFSMVFSEFGWLAALGVSIITSAAAFVLTLPLGHPLLSLFLLTLVVGFKLSSGPTVNKAFLEKMVGIEHLNCSLGIITFVRGLAAIHAYFAAGLFSFKFHSFFSFATYVACFCFGFSTFLEILIPCFYRSVQVKRGGYYPI